MTPCTRVSALTTPRDEADLDVLLQGGRDAAEHPQRVAAVVRVLEPRNHRLRRADQVRELLLGDPARPTTRFSKASPVRQAPYFARPPCDSVGFLVREPRPP